MNLKSMARLFVVFVVVLGAAGFAYGDTYTLSNSNGGDGYVSGSAPTFKLYGADNGVGSNYTTYTSTFTSPTTLTFNWSYTTHDCCGSYWDPAGYVLNGSYTQLSTDSQTQGQDDTSGTTTVSIGAGDTFGWYVWSRDSYDGRGELAVTTSVAPTPEPGSLFLMGTGLLGVAGALRRKLMV